MARRRNLPGWVGKKKEVKTRRKHYFPFLKRGANPFLQTRDCEITSLHETFTRLSTTGVGATLKNLWPPAVPGTQDCLQAFFQCASSEIGMTLPIHWQTMAAPQRLGVALLLVAVIPHVARSRALFLATLAARIGSVLSIACNTYALCQSTLCLHPSWIQNHRVTSPLCAAHIQSTLPPRGWQRHASLSRRAA